MPSTKLLNHLRRQRKRLALSQDEVAFLMGVRGGAEICRYEQQVCLPSLETALAFEVIYGVPISVLFEGFGKTIAKKIQERAKLLRHRVRFRGDDVRAQKRRSAMLALLSKFGGECRQRL